MTTYFPFDYLVSASKYVCPNLRVHAPLHDPCLIISLSLLASLFFGHSGLPLYVYLQSLPTSENKILDLLTMAADSPKFPPVPSHLKYPSNQKSFRLSKADRASE